MTRIVAILALLLAGCPMALPAGAERPPRESDGQAIDRLTAAWQSDGRPYPSKCRSERARMVVVRADQETSVGGYCASRGPCCGTMERQDACRCSVRRGGMGCAAGAQTYEGDIVQPLASITDTYRPMLWVSAYEDAATQETLVVHEATHWLMRCSSGRQDSAHATPGVWGAQGIEGRAWRR